MSADLNVNQIEEKISVLDQPEATRNNRVECNGNDKLNDKNDHDPVNAEDSVADQVGELKGDRLESESKTGFSDDQIKKEEDFQAVEKGREEKLVEILEDHGVEGNKDDLINHAELSNTVAEAQESQDTSVDVAESELNRLSNDEEKIEEENKLDTTIDIKEHEDSQAVLINGASNDLDLDQQRDLVELITTEDVAESEPNRSRNDEESKLDSEDSQSAVRNVVHNNLDLDLEKKPKELIITEDVAESEPNQSRNDEEKVEESKLDSEDSQPVVSNGAHNNLDLDQEKKPKELITTEDVAESEPNQSRNEEEKVDESKLDSEDSQSVVNNGIDNNLDLDQEKKLREIMNNDDVTEFKPKKSSDDGEKVEEECKLDLAIHVEEIEDSQAVVINGVPNSLDLNQEKEPSELVNDVPLEDSGEASGDSFEQNLKTAPCPVVADEKLEAESAEGPTSDANRDALPAGHVQDTVAETRVIDGLVDAKQNMFESSSENVELVATSDGETGKSFPIASDNGTSGDATNHILMDAVQSEVPDAKGLDIHEKGGLITSQESDSQTVLVNDLIHTPEQNHTSEISTELSSPVVHEDAPAESSESFPVSPINDDIVAEPAVRIEDSCPLEDTKLCDIVRTETKVDNIHANGGETADSHSVDDAKVEAEVENGPFVDYATPSCPTNDVKPDIGTGSHSIESDEKVSTLSSGNVDVESEVTGAVTEDTSRTSVSVDNPGGETFRCDSTENESHVPKIEVHAESEVENKPTAPSEEVPNRDGLVSQCEGSNDSVVAIENGGDQFIDRADDKKTCPEVGGFDEVSKDETPKSTLEDSAIGASDEQNVPAEVGKGPFYIIKVPKFDEKNLREKVEHAKFQVEEKSKSRDAIQAQIQIERAKRKEYEDSFTVARSEEKKARDLLKAKRKEIDSVQSVINRTRNVLEIEEIDGRIRTMEHEMQHETLSLKEEKQFIREIKQLKQAREQLSSNMGSQDEVQQAMDQKDQSEERLKSLRQEADVLRDSLLKAEAVTQDARKKYNDEQEKIIGLLADHRSANNVRQEAFSHLQNLRKQSYEKNKFFYKYKDDLTAATTLALKGDRDELQRHCANQVERVMELWNNNDEFRKEYVSSNMRSTLRRLRTLDGRALGPDEQPPVIPDVVSQRVVKDNIAPSTPALEVEKPVVPVETQKIDDKSTAKIEDKKNQTVKTRRHAKPDSLENGLPTVSGRHQIEEPRQEENKQTKEEEELARKAEELKKEKDAAMLKEQRRLEEKAKAKEALERKKRTADKAQARALQRAQREAEQKEKEKEKKARKKEKKKAAAEDTKDIDDVESAPSSETPTETKEAERTENPVTVTKKPLKPSQFAKQTKAKSMPLPLRNRGRRKMQTWMWALITLLAVLALFFMGNSSFFNFGLQQRSGI